MQVSRFAGYSRVNIFRHFDPLTCCSGHVASFAGTGRKSNLTTLRGYCNHRTTVLQLLGRQLPADSVGEEMSKIYSMEPEKPFVPLSTGEYHITLKSWREVVEEQDLQYSRKGDIKIEFTWHVTVPGGEDMERRVTASLVNVFSRKANLCLIGQALGVMDFEKCASDGWTFNPDQWIGKSCMASVVRQPKATDPKSMTDKFVSYSPLPATTFVPSPVGDVPLSPPAVDELTARYMTLLAFNDGEPAQVPVGLSRAQMVAQMRELGAMPLSDAGKRALFDERDVASMMAVTLPDELCHEPATVREGLLQLEAIRKLSGGN